MVTETEIIPVRVVLLGVDATSKYGSGFDKQWAVEELQKEMSKPDVNERTKRYIEKILNPHWATRPISTDHQGGA